MSLQDLINTLALHTGFIINYYILLSVLCLLGVLFITPSNFKAPLPYIYTALVYGISIPGLLAITLLLYQFFFLKQNILSLSITTYFLPILALIVLLLLIKKTVPLSKIPGFSRLSGLFVLIFITFILTYFMQRIFVGVFFVGSFSHIALIFMVLLVFLRIAWRRFTA